MLFGIAFMIIAFLAPITGLIIVIAGFRKKDDKVKDNELEITEQVNKGDNIIC